MTPDNSTRAAYNELRTFLVCTAVDIKAAVGSANSHAAVIREGQADLYATFGCSCVES